MAPGPDSSDSRVGTVIADRYRITAKLGEGGMGAVYRGVHESLRKPVALKFMVPSASADAELAQRFEREAVATANLKHPNISETTDYGQLPDGTLYLVMECIDGKNLRELVAAGRLAPQRVLAIVKQIGSALSFAHESDVVHRDLKPDNVIVFDRGSTSDLVKVIDFGIARMKSSFGGGKTALTQAGTVFGTPDYMAPEQALGQAVDPRADQYALGAIAYELFTGKPPYSADNTAALLFMHVGAPIPRVGDLVPDLPPQVSDVVAKMMAKLPDERFASVDEAVAALARAFEPTAPPAFPVATSPRAPTLVSAGVTPSASPPVPMPAPPQMSLPAPMPMPMPTAPAPRRSPLPWILAAAGLAVLFVGTGVLAWLFHVRTDPSATADADAGEPETALTTEPTASAPAQPTATSVKPSAFHVRPATLATNKPAATAAPTAPAATVAPAATPAAASAAVVPPPATPTNAPTSTPAGPGPTPTAGPPPGHGHGHH